MTQSEIAEKLARDAHTGQFRKLGDDKGKPYIIHPERVASRFPKDDILQAIAWLHDVVEDTWVTLADLKDADLCPEVILGVRRLTKIPNIRYIDYIVCIRHSIWARPVKIEDIRDNLCSLDPGSLRDKYQLALYILREV